jgi:transcriptional regulator with XRE-family HTH domain
MDVVKKINRMRLERGWSVYRLAVEADIPQSTLTNMFNRETLPSISTLEMICHAFHITMAEFFSEGDSAPNPRMDEAELRKAFDSLSDKDKLMVCELIARLSDKT